VRDRAEAKRVAASLKTAASFKVFEDTKAESSKVAYNWSTPVKAAPGKKVNLGRTPLSKTASIFKATPEKIAADKAAAAVLSRAVYEAECDRLEAEHEAKDDEWIRVIAVREAAHRRASADFESAHSRLSAEDLSFVPDEDVSWRASKSWKFAKQLHDSVRSHAENFNKAANDRVLAIRHYDKKMLKYFEVARLDWTER